MYSINYAEWVFCDVIPIYLQLKDKLRLAILGGGLQPGESIPSIRDMASILHINANTVAKAYKLIRNEGLILTSSGQTTKIISDNVIIQKVRKQEAQILCCNYVRGMMDLGFNSEESLIFIENYVHRLIERKNP